MRGFLLLRVPGFPPFILASATATRSPNRFSSRMFSQGVSAEVDLEMPSTAPLSTISFFPPRHSLTLYLYILYNISTNVYISNGSLTCSSGLPPPWPRHHSQPLLDLQPPCMPLNPRPQSISSLPLPQLSPLSSQLRRVELIALSAGVGDAIVVLAAAL